ncbi:MAG: dienelactone hydrolase family protein [Gemmatimonadota bacterium]|nr:dienelactone hydrolase family protein [Gemmatimonadota bacterium]
MSRTGSQLLRRLAVPAALAGVILPVAACVAGSEAGQGTSAEAAVAVPDTTIPAAILGRGAPPRGEAVSYLESDPATQGYLSVPEGTGPFPAIILIHEWNGLVDRIRQVADALADEGYVAFAADLYHGRTGANREENVALMQEARADPGGMIANLDAVTAWLKAREDVTGRIGAVGWCFGGGVALSFGLDGADHEATAIFYGSLIDDPERLSALSHEVYGTFGELDNGIPASQVRDFASALQQAGIENDIHVYEGVGHGFWLWVERDPAAATEPARDAWRRLREYFGRTLGD